MSDAAQGRATILIVEDQPDLLTDLAAVLCEEGYHTLAELSADAARRVLEHERPDLILCDIALPGTDGMAFLREIRTARPELDDVPFIMLSAFSEREDVVAGKRAGADDYLVKPVDYELLLVTVEARLREVDRLSVRREAKPASQSQQRPLRAAGAAEMGHVLDQLDFGLVLFDGRGELCSANRAARESAEARGMSLQQWARQTVGVTCLTRALGAATAALRRGEAFRQVLLGQLDELGADDPACEVADPAADEPQGGLRARAVVALSDLGHCPDDLAEPLLMALVFSDLHEGHTGARLISEAAGLTAAETEVAVLLAQGERLSDIATALTISRTTVSYHLRNIFQKTAMSRQADLVALLRSLPLRD